jgi:hypothetical protein
MIQGMKWLLFRWNGAAYGGGSWHAPVKLQQLHFTELIRNAASGLTNRLDISRTHCFADMVRQKP